MIRPDAFAFHNGRTARTAGDLLHVLEEGPPDLFEDHVRDDRNDFAAWAEGSLQERALAQRLREAKTRDETIATLRAWLAPHIARHEAQSHHSRKDFLLGLGIGIIIGVLVGAVIALL